LKPVLFVSHESSVSPGIASEVFEQEGIPLQVMRAWETTEWPEVRNFSGLVVLGGEMGAHDVEAFPFLSEVRALLSQAVEAEVPTLGICLGAQILALVLGGAVRRSPRVELGFGLLEATGEGRRDPVLGPFAGPVAVFQWHQDTFDLPEAATLLFSGGGFHQAFRYGRTVYGTQFHFEVTEQDVAAWIDATPPNRLQGHWGRSREELLREVSMRLPAQQEIGREAFRGFAKLLEG
jgi:GMP synthase (glutamine-hydrolysing)